MSTPALSRRDEALECIRLIISTQEQIAQGATASCLEVAPDPVVGELDNPSAALTEPARPGSRFGEQTNRADRDSQIAYLDILDHVRPSGGATAPIPPGLIVRVKPASIGQAAHDGAVPATAVTALIGACGRHSLSTVVSKPERADLHLETGFFPVISAHVGIPARECQDDAETGYRQIVDFQVQPCAEAVPTADSPGFSMLLPKPRGSCRFDLPRCNPGRSAIRLNDFPGPVRLVLQHSSLHGCA